MTPEEFASILIKGITDAQTSATPAPAPEPVQKGLTAEDLQKLLSASFAEFGKVVDSKIAKATEFSRQGTGRVGTVTPQDERDTDPLKYIVKKSKDIDNLDQTDKDLIAELTLRAIREGMISDETPNF